VSDELRFHGGWPGALAPFFAFLVGVSWLGLSGAPDETGFGPVLLVAIGVGFLLATDRERYAEAVIDGMSHRLVMLLVLAWLLAGVLGTVLQESGLVQALVWAAAESRVDMDREGEPAVIVELGPSEVEQGITLPLAERVRS